MSNVTMRQMLEAGVHFGHQTRFWNPKMAPYIFGERSKIHIINLEQTLPLFKEAMNFVGSLATNKAQILFVGTKRAARETIREEALRCGMPYVDQRWMGGMLTNYKTLKLSIRRLKDLEVMFADGSVDRLNKKEGLGLRRELDKLERSLGGIKDMNGLPDALFVVDVGHEKIAVNEAIKIGIPVIGIVDTNNNPANIDYVVPGNDDAIRSVKLYVSAAADAILEGRATLAQLAGQDDDFVEVDGDDASAALTEKGAKPAKPARKATKKIAVKSKPKAVASKKVAEAEAVSDDDAPVVEVAAEENPESEVHSDEKGEAAAT